MTPEGFKAWWEALRGPLAFVIGAALLWAHVVVERGRDPGVLATSLVLLAGAGADAMGRFFKGGNGNGDRSND